MSAGDKAIILAQVENKTRGKRQTLMALGIPKSSYYRWWRQGQPDSGNRKRPWNRITPEEEGKILAVAWESPELSSRQLAAWITDNAGFPATGRLDHRQRRLCRIRVNGIPHSKERRVGETSGDATHSR